MRIEIVKVANGYVCRPPTDFANGNIAAYDEMHVFQSFDLMVVWIKQTMKDGQ